VLPTIVSLARTGARRRADGDPRLPPCTRWDATQITRSPWLSPPALRNAVALAGAVVEAEASGSRGTRTVRPSTRKRSSGKERVPAGAAQLDHGVERQQHGHEVGCWRGIDDIAAH